MQFKSINPYNNSLLKSVNFISDNSLELQLSKAQAANKSWRITTIQERIDRILNLAELVEKNFHELAKLSSLEMGKPIVQAEGEVKKCAFVSRYYAENIHSFLESKHFELEGFNAKVVLEPLGTIFGIMPWNYPYWQVFRYAVPCLLSGNTVLLKHAPNLPQCASAIEQLFIDAGFNNNEFQNLYISHHQAEKVIQDKRVAAVTFTGSARTGRSIGASAGKALKKSVLELGGSDPFIVLEDANVKKAAQFAVKSRFNNAGQICIASKRWLVHDAVKDTFLKEAIDYLKTWQYGDPLDRSTDIGPMARQDLKQKLVHQVENLINDGAKIVHGSLNKNLHNGNYFEPLILENIDLSKASAQEELFGPVACLFTFSTEQEAIEMANNTEYGLGAAIWTENRDKALELSAKIETGTVAINGTVSSHPALPFGGVKNSGYGRELSLWGIYEFVNIKTLTIR